MRVSRTAGIGIREPPAPLHTPPNALGDARRAKGFEDVGSVITGVQRLAVGHFERLALF